MNQVSPMATGEPVTSSEVLGSSRRTPPRIRFGVNLNFAKYVYGPRRAFEVARELGFKFVEGVADNDFGPTFFVRDPDAYREYHRGVGRAAGEVGVEITSVFTVYRDSGAIGSRDAGVAESAYVVGRSLLEQAAAQGAPRCGAALCTLDREQEADAGEFDVAYERVIGTWKRWVRDARSLGLQSLAIEMSAARREGCATIAETRATLDELRADHVANEKTTVPVQLCYDTGHGISAAECPDADERDFRAWFEAFPAEIDALHLKNTDAEFLATEHFAEHQGSASGIDLLALVRGVRDVLRSPVVTIHLEVPGKRGRRIGEEAALHGHAKSREAFHRALEASGYRVDSNGTWIHPDGESA